MPAFPRPAGMLRIAATALAAGAVAVGCGGDDGTASATPRGLPLARAPDLLVRSCKRAAKGSGVPVRCATRFIAGVRLDRHMQRFTGRGFYAYEAIFTGLARAGAQHVVFGGQRRPITFGRDPATLGLTSRLGFRGHMRAARKIEVNGVRAVVLLVPPRTGLNGGHLVVAWNAGGASYFAAVHLERLTFARRLATARALAASVAH